MSRIGNPGNPHRGCFPIRLIFRDRQHGIACSDLAVQIFRKVQADWDVVDIHKDFFAAECRAKPIVQPTGKITLMKTLPAMHRLDQIRDFKS